ncbi:MAG: VWA domain-containing protein [Deltaproteobacteria bacterium]|nr:VWA domain-containing protein [Deltaproteobacteria bacterium]
MQSKNTKSMSRVGFIVILGVFFICMELMGGGIYAARQSKPLLIPGKRTLYQKVITHPGTKLYALAGNSAKVLEKWVKPFTVFYVYQRATVGGGPWLEVGISSTEGPIGWIKGSKTSDWNQALTLVFTERTGRQPALFFKDLKSLQKVAGSPSPSKQAAQLASQFATIQSGSITPPAQFSVLAVEPPEEAVSREQFYIMPIFQALELFEGVKFLEVASIDPGSGRFPEDLELKTAIVFVIDTTISMKPYIDRTREAVRKIYDAIEKAGLSEKVAFGLVAFRNSTKKTPGVEYVTRVLSDLRDGQEREQFELALAQTQEAKVSTHSFNEDAFAGLKMALEELNWSPYLSRLAFLITDAGAIRNDDPFSYTDMNEAEIADMAVATGVKIFALHLKTPAGRKASNHPYAEAQYKALTGYSDPMIGDLYVPIEAAQPAAGVRGFGRVVEGVSAQMVELVRATSMGERLTLPEVPTDRAGDVVQEAVRKAAILGYAMQLEFLGSRAGVQAPKIVKAWVSDMDLARPDTPAFKVAVLLSKNQLSDLSQRLKIILDQAQRTKRTGAKDFFQSILGVAAQMSRDPLQFSKKPNQNLGELGVLAEFLDDLPYRSNIMRLTEEDWYRLSVGEQQAIINNLKSKIRRYTQIHNDVANWVTFGAAEPGDAVYRIPLSLMP